MLLQELKLRNYPYKSRCRLSERIVGNYLLKEGYEVFRGTAVLGHEHSIYYGLYPNVKNKYDRLERILVGKIGLRLYILREMLDTGIPDFFVHKDGKCFFAEVKLEHESIKKNQLGCMKLLESFGFEILILRVKSKPYRISSIVNIADDKLNVMKVLLRQKRLLG